MIAPIHPYDDVRIFEKEAKTLSAHGYQVHLIARADKAGVIDGITVVPVVAPFPGLLRFLNAPLIVVQALWHQGAVYHLHNPDTIPVALALRLFGRRVVYDTHEDFAQRILIRDWIPRFLRPALATAVVAGERLIAKVGDAIIVTQTDLRGRYGAKSVFLDNPPVLKSDAVDKAREFAAGLPVPDRLTLVYVGGLNEAKGLREMVDLAAAVNEIRPCRLRLIGPLAKTDREYAESLPGWRYVDYLGRMPQWQALAHVINSHLGLVLARDVGDQAKSNTNKLFEYMAFATPFVASDFAHWRDSVGASECGLFCDPGDARGMARAIVDLFDRPDRLRAMGEAGRRFVEDGYNWEKTSERLVELYRRICPPPPE